MSLMKMAVTQTPFEDLEGQNVAELTGTPEVAIVPAATDAELPAVLMRFRADENEHLDADVIVQTSWHVPMAIQELLVKAFPNLQQYEGQLVNLEGFETGDGDGDGQG